MTETILPLYLKIIYWFDRTVSATIKRKDWKILKLIINHLTLAVMVGSVVSLFIVALSAMLSGGNIILKFNVFNEGWFEVFLLGIFIIPSLLFVEQERKRLVKRYCKRSEIK